MIGSHKINACATSYMEPDIHEEPHVLCVSLCMAYIRHLQAHDSAALWQHGQ